MQRDGLNRELIAGHTAGVADHLPRLKILKTAPFKFTIAFGLDVLPEAPRILMIRGPRQYGKSTWLEQQIKETVKAFGAGSAFYVNGDYLAHADALESEIATLVPLFSTQAKVRRIFIDEITAIDHWEIALKRLADAGVIRDVLLITTGSKATDLRRGAEKLPGRKGKLAKSSYYFGPISYAEFHRHCHKLLKEKTLTAYLLSGGSPIACTELATTGYLPEYLIELVRDWIEGEIARTGRARHALLNILQTLYRYGGSPLGQAKLAREAGLANNTIADNYLQILADLGCVLPAYHWDVQKRIRLFRKPCKYHFTNLLAAVVYHPAQIRSVADFEKLPSAQQGMWYEWLIAQEITRQTAIAGGEILAPLAFWQNQTHEIDFAVDDAFIEVKRGKCNPLEFAWFVQTFPGAQLNVINAEKFATNAIVGVPFEQFLQR